MTVAVDKTTLDCGTDLTVVNAVAAAQVIGSAGSGLAATNPTFGIPEIDAKTGRTLNLHGTGVAAPPTTMKVTLLRYSYATQTWNAYQAEISLCATAIFTDAQAINLTPGLYQVIVTTLTLGATCTSVGVDASVS